jgi:hypothetical protein
LGLGQTGQTDKKEYYLHGRKEGVKRWGMQGTCAGKAGASGPVKAALQSQMKRLWLNGNRKVPPPLSTAHSALRTLPKGWNANPNTKTAREKRSERCMRAAGPLQFTQASRVKRWLPTGSTDVKTP